MYVALPMVKKVKREGELIARIAEFTTVLLLLSTTNTWLYSATTVLGLMAYVGVLTFITRSYDSDNRLSKFKIESYGEHLIARFTPIMIAFIMVDIYRGLVWIFSDNYTLETSSLIGWCLIAFILVNSKHYTDKFKPNVSDQLEYLVQRREASDCSQMNNLAGYGFLIICVIEAIKLGFTGS